MNIYLHRYENLWLPLLSQVSNGPNEDLLYLPPTDVHWLWHVHMLSPTSYAKDCLSIHSRVYNHQLVGLEELGKRRELSRSHWRKMFPGDPFDLPEDKSSILKLYRSVAKQPVQSRFRYDVIAAAQRQKSFFHQVSLPHFGTDWFLEEAVSRYSKFLHLKKLYKKEFLVPCYDVDLVWHTHQVHPLAYQDDCQNILGSVLPHDDTDPDRTEGSKLDVSFKTTQELWKSTFGIDYCQPGINVSNLTCFLTSQIFQIFSTLLSDIDRSFVT